MAPRVNSWEELLWVSEEFDDDTGDFQYTMFAAVEDDAVYYGQLPERQAAISFQTATDCLDRVPDETIFTPWPPPGFTFTKAPDELPLNAFIKRPRLALYDVLLKHRSVHMLAKGLFEEAEAMEIITSQRHPNIVGYHGCRVRRGFITGLVIDRHGQDLEEYIKRGQTLQNREAFFKSLKLAIQHIHSLGWAHNDLNPSNVLIADDGRPVLIDFGSARPIGDKLSTSRGTKGWIDGEMKDYATSETKHDASALVKIRNWIENPTFEH